MAHQYLHSQKNQAFSQQGKAEGVQSIEKPAAVKVLDSYPVQKACGSENFLGAPPNLLGNQPDLIHAPVSHT